MEGSYIQIAIGHIQNMKDSDDTTRVSPKRMNADKTKGG